MSFMSRWDDTRTRSNKFLRCRWWWCTAGVGRTVPLLDYNGTLLFSKIIKIVDKLLVGGCSFHCKSFNLSRSATILWRSHQPILLWTDVGVTVPCYIVKKNEKWACDFFMARKQINILSDCYFSLFDLCLKKLSLQQSKDDRHKN